MNQFDQSSNKDLQKVESELPSISSRLWNPWERHLLSKGYTATAKSNWERRQKVIRK